MSGVFQTVLFVVATALLCVLLRSVKQEFSIFAGIAGCIIVLIAVFPQLRRTTEVFGRISFDGEIGETARQCIQAMAIVLLCEFAAAICKDAGQNALALHVSFFGRATICALCAPLFAGLIDSLGSLSSSF